MSHVAWALIGVGVLTVIVLGVVRARRDHHVNPDMGSVSDRWLVQQHAEQPPPTTAGEGA